MKLFLSMLALALLTLLLLAALAWFTHLPAIEDRYGELAMPVGVLCGRDDAILDWRMHGQAFADQAPGAWLELVDGGHTLPVTRPALTAAFVERVVQRAVQRTAARASGA